MTMDPFARSVATSSSLPSSDTCTSPSVVAFSTMSESTSTGDAPAMFQMWMALPNVSPRLPHVDVYATLPRVHTSAM